MIKALYLLQMGFHLVAVVSKLGHKDGEEAAVYKRRNITETQNTQNRRHNKRRKQIKIIIKKQFA
jgi:hypothetical protein